MKKIILLLRMIFTTLTLVGAGYILMNDGQVSPGYAVVPMIFTSAFRGLYCELEKR